MIGRGVEFKIHLTQAEVTAIRAAAAAADLYVDAWMEGFGRFVGALPAPTPRDAEGWTHARLAEYLERGARS